MRLAFWRKPQRRQASARVPRHASPPALAERVDWRGLGIKACALLAVLGAALLLRVALDRPVRRVLVQGSFQRVSAPEIESVVTKAIDAGLASVDLAAVRREVEK